MCQVVVTILREGGFRVVIYLDDHEPAHVHVIGAGEAKINLAGSGDAPELVWSVGMSRADLRKPVLSACLTGSRRGDADRGRGPHRSDRMMGRDPWLS